MTTDRIHQLTNLSADRYFELSVPQGQDVLAAAREKLSASDLSPDVQHGFFVSVFSGPVEQDQEFGGSDPGGVHRVHDDLGGSSPVATGEDSRAETGAFSPTETSDYSPTGASDDNPTETSDHSPVTPADHISDFESPGVEGEAAVSNDSSVTGQPEELDTEQSEDESGGNRGSLAAAAAQGPMHWTDDPAIDPPGVDDNPVVVVPIGSAGGH